MRQYRDCPIEDYQLSIKIGRASFAICRGCRRCEICGAPEGMISTGCHVCAACVSKVYGD